MAEKHTHSEPSGKIWTKGELSTSFYYSCVYGINCLKVSIFNPIHTSIIIHTARTLYFVCFQAKIPAWKIKKKYKYIYRYYIPIDFSRYWKKICLKKVFKHQLCVSNASIVSSTIIRFKTRLFIFAFWLRTRKYFLMNTIIVYTLFNEQNYFF